MVSPVMAPRAAPETVPAQVDWDSIATGEGEQETETEVEVNGTRWNTYPIAKKSETGTLMITAPSLDPLAITVGAGLVGMFPEASVVNWGAEAGHGVGDDP